MKKILFTSLNDHVPWGGSEELWSKVALHLSGTYKIAVLIKKWKNAPMQIGEFMENNVEVFYKPVNKEKIFIKVVLNKFKHKFGFKKNKLKNDFNSVKNIQDFDLVVLSVGNHSDSKILEYTNYLKILNKSYLIIVQLATDLQYLDDNILLGLKEAYENAKGVCYLCEDNLKIIEMQFGFVLANKIKIDNPFNFGQNYVLPLEQQNYNVACVASFTTFHKGQELLLRSISNQKWQERNIIFNLYGSGINENQIRRLIKIYKLENKVNLKGYEPDINKIWKENIVCIMPSRMEGQSLAMLEAMSFGRMVISTKVGDAQRLVKHNETGFLINAPTVEFIEIALDQAWESRTNWVEMGKLSRKHLYDTIKKDSVIDFSEKLQILLK